MWVGIELCIGGGGGECTTLGEWWLGGLNPVFGGEDAGDDDDLRDTRRADPPRAENSSDSLLTRDTLEDVKRGTGCWLSRARSLSLWRMGYNEL